MTNENTGVHSNGATLQDQMYLVHGTYNGNENRNGMTFYLDGALTKIGGTRDITGQMLNNLNNLIEGF